MMPTALPQQHDANSSASTTFLLKMQQVEHSGATHLLWPTICVYICVARLLQLLHKLFPDLVFHAAHYIIPPGCNLFELQILGGKSDRWYVA